MQGTNGSQPPRAQRRALTEPSAPLQETSWGHGVEGSSLPRPPPAPITGLGRLMGPNQPTQPEPLGQGEVELLIYL